jgi:predicted enzyme related to lactoylglutathione lyase
MPPHVQSMIAVAYVKDIGVSRGFYELLGFREHSSDKSGDSAWSVMRHGQVSVLLAMTRPPLGIPPLPMLSYLFFEDIDAVATALERAGVAVERTGHPPHALGGEARAVDPDGNTVMLGQRERSASQGPSADEGEVRFSVLREAAALVASRGGARRACEIPDQDGQRCPNQAEIKLADSLGDSAWACMTHADQILVTVPAAFIAAPDGQGIAAFVANRRSRP